MSVQSISMRKQARRPDAAHAIDPATETIGGNAIQDQTSASTTNGTTSRRISARPRPELLADAKIVAGKPRRHRRLAAAWASDTSSFARCLRRPDFRVQRNHAKRQDQMERRVSTITSRTFDPWTRSNAGNSPRRGATGRAPERDLALESGHETVRIVPCQQISDHDRRRAGSAARRKPCDVHWRNCWRALQQVLRRRSYYCLHDVRAFIAISASARVL